MPRVLLVDRPAGAADVGRLAQGPEPCKGFAQLAVPDVLGTSSWFGCQVEHNRLIRFPLRVYRLIGYRRFGYRRFGQRLIMTPLPHAKRTLGNAARIAGSSSRIRRGNRNRYTCDGRNRDMSSWRVLNHRLIRNMSRRGRRRGDTRHRELRNNHPARFPLGATRATS